MSSLRRWWKTALRLKSDRHTNGTLANIYYKDIIAVGVDLVFDVQMWYPCQNQSGMHNYELCRSYYTPEPGYALSYHAVLCWSYYTPKPG